METTLGLLFLAKFFAYTLEDTHREVKVAGQVRLGNTKSAKVSESEQSIWGIPGKVPMVYEAHPIEGCARI